jgi:hypothetical protein
MKKKKVTFVKDKPKEGSRAYYADLKFTIHYDDGINQIGLETFDSKELSLQVNSHLRAGYEISIKMSDK